MIDISKLESVKECQEVIKSAKKRQKELVQSYWFNAYSEVCGEDFIPLEEALSWLNYEIKDRNSDTSTLSLSSLVYELAEEVYFGNDANNVSISMLISKMNQQGLTLSSYSKLAKMICKRCECRGCTACVDKSQESWTEKQKVNCATHCNGYSCQKCRQDGYQGYDWVCEE